MGSADIQAKIKKGLARAVNKTGSVSSEKVYLVVKTTTAGTPLNPGVTTEVDVELLNAIFINYDATSFDVNIIAGDRKLFCDNSEVITQGDTIKQGASIYYVVSLAVIAPTSDVLAYMPQVRLK